MSKLKEKYRTVTQIAKITGITYPTVHKILTNENDIEYERVGSALLIPVTSIPKIKEHYARYQQNKGRKTKVIEGYKSVGQACKALDINFRTLKNYIYNDYFPEVKVIDGKYYLPDELFEELQALGTGIKRVNFTNLDASRMDCMTIQATAEELGYADSYIRTKIREGELKAKRSVKTGKNYITKESIEEYKKLHAERQKNATLFGKPINKPEDDDDVDDLADML